MSKPDETGEQFLGCLTCCWVLFVTGPMYLILLHAILVACEAPDYAWVLYWCYVPACIIGIILNQVFKMVAFKK